MARQIGKMLNCHEPKIVNGPEVLNRFVGASEENIRKLFEDAENEYENHGDNSRLHIIIFDELDSICRARGSTTSNIGDSVVNQLLSKIDGINALNNIIIIGMTNRIELIDSALLRPGRLEVHIEISLPDENGRIEILNIHTSQLRANQKISENVNVETLARMTPNYTGAEIEGVIRDAISYAMYRQIDPTNLHVCHDDLTEKITFEDFKRAIEENPPAHGVAVKEIDDMELVECDDELIDIIRNVESGITGVLLYGGVDKKKTKVAVSLAIQSKYPFIRLISPQMYIGMNETTKIQKINEVFTSAYRSERSIIILEDVERLLEYTPIGPRFSNAILQTLMVLSNQPPPNSKTLIVIATSSEQDFLVFSGLERYFRHEYDTRSE